MDALRELSNRIQEDVGTGVKVLPVQMDVSLPDNIKNFVGNLPEPFKKIDVLVNNA